MPDTLQCYREIKIKSFSFGNADSTKAFAGSPFMHNYGSTEKTIVTPDKIYGSSSISPFSAQIKNTPTVENFDSISWQSITILSIIILFCGLLIVMRNSIKKSLKILVSYKSAHKEYQEETRIEALKNNYLKIFGIVVVSLFIFKISQYYYYPQTNWKYAISIFAAISVIMVLKYIFARIAGAVTKSNNLISELNFNKNMILGTVSILLFLPLLALFLYNNQTTDKIILYIVAIIAVSGTIFASLRITTVFKAASISNFYVFLYLCIFEISPFLLLYIVIKEYSSILVIANSVI